MKILQFRRLRIGETVLYANRYGKSGPIPVKIKGFYFSNQRYYSKPLEYIAKLLSNEEYMENDFSVVGIITETETTANREMFHFRDLLKQ